MTQHDVEVPVPLLVGHLDEVRVARHPNDVDDAVDAAEFRGGVLEQPFHVGPVGGVADERLGADFGGDVGGEVAVHVDGHQARADRRQGVRRLPPDALPCADHDEPSTVEPQQSLVVRDRRVVGSGHEPVTAASTVTSCFSSSGMTSVPSSSMVRMIDSCDRCPNCT